MTKLSQIVAIEKGVKAKSQRSLTDAYHIAQKPAPFSGIARTYRPKDEEGDQLPSESTLVQMSAETLLRSVGDSLTRLFDITVTKDSTNCRASADVVVDGVVLLPQLPVTSLIFLEKQLVDIRTFIQKLPTLDPSEKWQYDSATGTWVTETSQTTRTKKTPRNHVKSPATDKHPAQVEMYYEDVIVGYWSTTKLSGALPADRVTELVERVDRLIEAVKFAREEANSVDVIDVPTGKKVFDYLLAP